MQLIKPGSENGLNILKDPEGKQICLGSVSGLHGGYSVRFGYVDKGNCNLISSGVHNVSLASDNARLVYIPKGGAWLPLNEAKAKGYIQDDKMLMKAEKANPGYAKNVGTGAYYIMYSGLWYANNNKDQHILEQTHSDQIQVFIPGAPAPTPAPAPVAAPVSKSASTADAPNPLFGVHFQHVELVRPGGENGRAILTTPDTQNQVCAVAYNLGNMKQPGEIQIPFGYVLDVNGKKSCRIEAWGSRDYAFDAYQENVFLVHPKTQGSWKPIKEMQENDWQSMVIVPKTTDPKLIDSKLNDPQSTTPKLGHNLSNGIASLNGIPGKTHTEHRNYYGGSGDVNNKQPVVNGDASVRIYIPTPVPTPAAAPVPEPVLKSDATPVVAPAATITETPVSKPAETPAPAATPVATPAVTTTETPVSKPAETPAPAATPVAPVITQTAQGPITEAQIRAAINEGRVVVDDPDIAIALEAQKPISLDGEAFKWVDFGKGFALQPVSLSPTSGVICRLFGPNNQAYIGNVYKNNRATTSDIALSEIKVGEFVCRAGTDLQGNKVHITSKFQTFGNRGSDVLWAPITSTQVPMWETGYKAINAGEDVTENGKTFKASGICRISKPSEPTKFHIGRATVDQNNITHCYLKSKGIETDITGQPLQSVEVLIKSGLAQTAVSSTVGQQGVMNSATESLAIGSQVPGKGMVSGVNPFLQPSLALPTQAPANTMFG